MKTRSFSIVIAFLSALIVYTYGLRYRHVESPPTPPLDSIPSVIGGFTGSTERENPESLEILGADATLFRVYRSDSGRVAWLFIGYFGTLNEHSQIHSPKHCYPGVGWNIVGERPVHVPIENGEISARSLDISDGVRTQYVLYWFSSADGIITNEFALKWHQMKSALLGRPQASAFVRFSIDATGYAAGSSRDFLARFAGTLAPHIEGILRASNAAPSRVPEAGEHPATANPEAASEERTP